MTHTAGDICPGGQAGQDLAPAAENVLAAQPEHDLASATELYDPAAQGTQLPFLRYCPGAHDVGFNKTQCDDAY
jgi:hypothetical protein